MREWQCNGNLALAESREPYCLFSQRTLLSNIFTTTRIAEASKQASTYLNKCLLFSRRDISDSFLSFDELASADSLSFCREIQQNYRGFFISKNRRKI